MIALISIVSAVVLLLWTAYINRIKLFKKLGIASVSSRCDGPWRVPVLGNLLSFGTSPHVSLTNLRDTYGGAYSLQLGSHEAIMLASYDALGLLQKHGTKLSSRPRIFQALEVITEGGKDIAMSSYSQRWRLWRKTFAHRMFSRSNAAGYRSVLQDEAVQLVDTFRKAAKSGEPFDPYFALKRAAMNTIVTLTFGVRFDDGNEELVGLVDALAEVFRVAGAASLADFIPALRVLPQPNLRVAAEKTAIVEAFLSDQVARHLDTYVPGAEPRDWCDIVLETQRNYHTDEPGDGESSGNMVTTEHGIKAQLNLFGAGTDTSSTTLHWLVFYWMQHPETLRRVQRELDEVVGPDPAFAEFTDDAYARFPYTHACIFEAMRLRTVVPFSLPHLATEDVDTTIDGKPLHIPTGTILMPNAYACHMDTSVWGSDAAVFRPDRFLELDEQEARRRILSFSVGPRRCLGEPLARQELFVFATALARAISLAPVPGQSYTDDAIYGLTLQPHPFEVIVKER
jgi:cytochrome P450